VFFDPAAAAPIRRRSKGNVSTRRSAMKALVYNGPGQRSWHEVPDPVIQDPEDAIVRVDAVTICGTDLHILKGDVPTVQPGRILVTRRSARSPRSVRAFAAWPSVTGC
jgi:hypothetical protein